MQAQNTPVTSQQQYKRSQFLNSVKRNLLIMKNCNALSLDESGISDYVIKKFSLLMSKDQEEDEIK